MSYTTTTTEQLISSLQKSLAFDKICDVLYGDTDAEYIELRLEQIRKDEQMCDIPHLKVQLEQYCRLLGYVHFIIQNWKMQH